MVRNFSWRWLSIFMFFDMSTQKAQKLAFVVFVTFLLSQFSFVIFTFTLLIILWVFQFSSPKLVLWFNVDFHGVNMYFKLLKSWELSLFLGISNNLLRISNFKMAIDLWFKFIKILSPNLILSLSIWAFFQSWNSQTIYQVFGLFISNYINFTKRFLEIPLSFSSLSLACDKRFKKYE